MLRKFPETLTLPDSYCSEQCGRDPAALVPSQPGGCDRQLRRSFQSALALMAACTLGVLAAVSSQAAQVTYDFSQDLSTISGLDVLGNNSEPWRASGGNPGGFLALTYAENSQNSVLLFPNLDPGKVVTAFKLECDLRVGNSTGDRPADGFSISFARAGDPVLVNNDGTGFAGLEGGSIPETGTTTGIAINFDTWSGNPLPDGSDIEGIMVRVDNKTVLKQGLPTRHGACDDQTSLQTGPRDAAYWSGGGDPRDPAAWAGLCWKPFSVELTTDGKLTVTYKGKVLLDNFQTTYFPTPGRLVLAGRTGGANENTHIDNLKLTTTAVVTDAEKPTTPTDFKAVEVGTSRVLLSWGPSTDNSGRVAYELERDGQKIGGLLTDTQYEDKGVRPSTTYAYKVWAIDLSQNTSTPASLTVKTVAEVPSIAFAKAEYYTGAGGVSVDDLLAMPNYPDSPNATQYRDAFESQSGFGDNYGGRLSATLTPAASGNYVFFISADDHAELWLSTDANPANKVLIATEPDWNGVREWVTADRRPGCPDACENRSTPVALQAGKQYYIEALWKEGGGGDNCAVTWIKEGDPLPASGSAPLGGAILSTLADPVGASVTITQQPADTTAGENEKATFTVTADVKTPYGMTVYQWYKNGVAISGATSSSYTTPLLKLSDNGAKFKVLVAVVGGNATSAEATLTVKPDVTPPTVLKATGSQSFTSITIQFSEPVDSASAQTAGNYTLDKGLTVSSASVVSPDTVRLTTSKQAEDTAYALTIKNVKDTANNTADTTVTFRSFAFLKGVMQWEFWGGIGGVDLQTLKDDTRYPGTPDRSGLVSAYEAPVDYADNHGTKVSGWITPETTGSYTFFFSSDDHGELYLSTDDNPANAVLIASEPDWNGARQWLVTDRRNPDAPENRSGPITLTAGKRYFTYLIFKEGGGGDNGAATWKLGAAADPANGSPALRGNAIGTFADPASGPPVITKQPEGASPAVGGTHSMSVEVGYGARPLSYRWQFGSGSATMADIPDGTNETLTISNVDAGDIGYYRVVVSNSDGTTTSALAFLSVDGALFIEAEDYNFGGGKWIKDKPIGMTGAYPGGDYRDLGTEADNGVDYNANGANGQPYRPSTLVSAGKPNQHPDGLLRGSFNVSVNHVVGWNDGGEWLNYTRQFPTPAKDYNVIGRLSSGGAPLRARLDEVQAGGNLKFLGEWAPGRATANWDTMEVFPLTDTTGALAKVTLGGETTIRFTVADGANIDEDFYMFVPAPEAGPMIKITGTAADDLKIEFTGSLQSSDTVTGPYTDVAGATSPFSVNPNTPQRFYRSRK